MKQGFYSSVRGFVLGLLVVGVSGAGAFGARLEPGQLDSDPQVCGRLLAPDALIDPLTQTDSRLSTIDVPGPWSDSKLGLPQICGPFCLAKAEVKLHQLLGEELSALEVLDELLSEKLPIGLSSEELFQIGVKVWHMRDWFKDRMERWAHSKRLRVSLEIEGSSFITDSTPKNVTFETLSQAPEGSQVVLALMHIWRNPGDKEDEELIRRQIENASLDPGDAHDRHWVIIRNAFQVTRAGEQQVLVQIEDPFYEVLLQGQLLSVSPPQYGFSTWRFYNPDVPNQLMIFTGALSASVK